MDYVKGVDGANHCLVGPFSQYREKHTMATKIKYTRYCKGLQNIFVDGKEIGSVTYSEHNKQWFSENVYSLGLELDFCLHTLRDLKIEIQRAVDDHTGPTVWHTAGE